MGGNPGVPARAGTDGSRNGIENVRVVLPRIIRGAGRWRCPQRPAVRAERQIEVGGSGWKPALLADPGWRPPRHRALARDEKQRLVWMPRHSGRPLHPPPAVGTCVGSRSAAAVPNSRSSPAPYFRRELPGVRSPGRRPEEAVDGTPVAQHKPRCRPGHASRSQQQPSQQRTALGPDSACGSSGQAAVADLRAVPARATEVPEEVAECDAQHLVLTDDLVVCARPEPPPQALASHVGTEDPGHLSGPPARHCLREDAVRRAATARPGCPRDR